MDNKHEHEPGLDDRRTIPYCNHIPAQSNKISDWIPMIAIIGGMIVSWTSLNTDMTKLQVNQVNIKEDLSKLDSTFEKHSVNHLRSMNNIKDQVDSLEMSMSGFYRNRANK